MDDKIIKFKDYLILVVREDRIGDTISVFFKVERGEEIQFTLRVKDALRSSRNRILREICDYLEEEGLKDVKDIIERKEYKKEESFEKIYSF